MTLNHLHLMGFAEKNLLKKKPNELSPQEPVYRVADISHVTE